ncbi:MAG: DUF4013 domain-containing protein [Methanomicrobium sp.]|nr:DUF4013 domain-containing protein [Methanomicrobium sp.]
MDIGMLFSDSFDYAKEAVVGKWVKWILLIISAIIFPLLLGYELMVLRGEKPAPELGNWVKLFIDGLLYFIISLIYSIPIFIVAMLTIGAGFFALAADPSAAVAGLGAMAIGLLLTIIVSIIISLIAAIASVRFARTGKFGEAFNFGEIIGKIKSIGWVNYFIQILVMVIVIGVLVTILNMIPVIGQILYLILIPVIAIFSARYICLIYDSA